MKKINLLILISALACSLVPTTGFAQEVTASLTGVVTDSTGASVPGATVVIRNNATKTTVRTVTTNNGGVYSAELLPYGAYTVTIQKTGFKNYVADDVILHVGDHRALNAQLQAGGVTQSVTVTSSTTPVQTSSAAESGTVTGTQVSELELNNRNFEQLLTLEPGVSSSLPDQIGFGITNTDAISVNGARTSANNWTVDGADINDSGSNLTLLNVPSIDALTEFTLERGTYDAQYGRSGGGQVNVVTKSGTSSFHGDAYEFVRNDVFNASPFLTNASNGVKPPFRYNDFGFTLGGPIFVPGRYNTDKSKTFFFWSEEWRKTRVPSTGTALLPPAQELTGNFQGIATLNAAAAPAGCITGNQISPSCFSANAKVYLQDVYSKLQPNVAGTNDLITSLEGLNNYRQDLIRLDQRVGNKVQAFARFMQDQVPTTEPGGLFAGSPLPGISSTATNAPGRNIVAHVTMELSPTVVNEVAFNYSWGAINSSLTGLVGQSSFKSALTNQLPFSDPYGRVPGVSITGVSGVAIPSAPYHERNVDKNLYDNVSLTRGNQTIRTGLSVQWMRKSENGPLPTNGSFTFNNATNNNPAFANFLLGDAAIFSQANQDVIPDIHFVNLGAYVQDDWKVRPNLTLNVGLRYDFLATPHDIHGILDNFDPTTFSASSVPAIDPVTGRFVAGQSVTPANYLNGIIVGGKNSPYGNRVNPNYNTNFSPRVGFAWDPFKDGKTSVRAGYGIYYDRTLNGIWEQNQFADPPIIASLTLLNASFDNPSNGAPPATILSPRNLHGTGSPAFKVPYEQDWNFSLQREVAPNTMVEMAYVGSKGTHLLGEYDLNQVPVALRAANPTVNANALRPYPGWGTINVISPEFNSNYNSLQISANRRTSHGLDFGLAYTWSQTLAENSTDRSTASYDTYNRGLDYGPASYSRPQVLEVNYVYDLPFFQGQTGAVGHLLGGWEISGITTIETGQPQTVTQSLDPFDSIAGSGIGIDPSAVSPRPDLIAPVIFPRSASQWFSAGSFKDAKGHFGNSGRGIFVGPGWDNWDFSLFKNTKISERFSTQLRAEFFNVFNNTSFSALGTNIDAGTFGKVTATHDPRIIQLGMKLYF